LAHLDKSQKRWLGPVFAALPEDVLTELNGAKRPERLTELMRKHGQAGPFADTSY